MSNIRDRAVARQREVLMCSPLRTDLDATNSRALAVTVSEPGWADLSRLLLFAVNPDPDAGQGTDTDLVPRLFIESLMVANMEELVRGREPVALPAGPFSPFRQFSPIQFGRKYLDSGESIEVTARIVDTSITDGNFAVAVPFLPDRLSADAGSCRAVDQPHAYVGSNFQDLAQGAATDFQVIMDEDGVVDLDSLQILGGLKTMNANYAKDVTASLLVRKITLPSGEELILGKADATLGAPAAPGSTFAHMGRANAWVHLGQVPVREEDVLTVRIESRVGIAGSASRVCVGARFYPSLQLGKR